MGLKGLARIICHGSKNDDEDGLEKIFRLNSTLLFLVKNDLQIDKGILISLKILLLDSVITKSLDWKPMFFKGEFLFRPAKKPLVYMAGKLNFM